MFVFWNWQARSGEEPARLRLDGVIDSGESWFEDAVTPRRFREELDAHEGETIVVEINSPGGDVFAAFDILDMLEQRKGVTKVRIPALCASAASIVAMGADPGELVMTRTGMMMIHNPIVGACGNAENLREHAQVLDELTDIMVGIYMQRFTGTEKELRALLDAESYIGAQDALKYGLADRLEESGSKNTQYAARYAASMDTVLTHVPDAVRDRKKKKAAPSCVLSAQRRREIEEAERQYHKMLKD